jgi:hypothetical protein
MATQSHIEDLLQLPDDDPDELPTELHTHLERACRISDQRHQKADAANSHIKTALHNMLSAQIEQATIPQLEMISAHFGILQNPDNTKITLTSHSMATGQCSTRRPPAEAEAAAARKADEDLAQPLATDFRSWHPDENPAYKQST